MASTLESTINTVRVNAEADDDEDADKLLEEVGRDVWAELGDDEEEEEGGQAEWLSDE